MIITRLSSESIGVAMEMEKDTEAWGQLNSIEADRTCLAEVEGIH